MTDFLDEYRIRERLRELEALDRRLERWGWFRRHGTAPSVPGWRFRLGERLVRLGFRLQGRRHESREPRAESGAPGA
jgi:hypothetical protein